MAQPSDIWLLHVAELGKDLLGLVHEEDLEYARMQSASRFRAHFTLLEEENMRCVWYVVFLDSVRISSGLGIWVWTGQGSTAMTVTWFRLLRFKSANRPIGVTILVAVTSWS